MEIKYQATKDIDADQLRNLFLSVEWDSGNYPDKLKVAICNSHQVYTAWDQDRLVGLINSLADGIMTVYFHYLLVRPDYQGKGIGKKLIELMLEDYKEYARKVLIAYDDALRFYEKCGFEVGKGKVPMFLTYLTT